jgi:flavin-dependent thymidylate synthase
LEIILAGYNVDADVLNELAGTPGRDDATPETISAAYARISRDPRPVNQLRRSALKEVEKARKSNRSIIFGMGHHSVAEHAVFNFDIMGVSRLAIEEIERFRLCSYTEKSQRYIVLEDEFIMPDEIRGSHLEKLFIAMVDEQQAFYRKSFDRVREKTRGSHRSQDGVSLDERTVEGMAKEDARYILPLSTAGQLGETINARNLELLLRRFASHRLSEVREIGRRMYECVADVAPSVIIFMDANDYDQKTYPALRDLSEEFTDNGGRSEDVPVRLLDFTRDADIVLMASLLHTSSGMSYSACRKAVEQLPGEKRRGLVKTACQYMELYDAALRPSESTNTFISPLNYSSLHHALLSSRGTGWQL